MHTLMNTKRAGKNFTNMRKHRSYTYIQTYILTYIHIHVDTVKSRQTHIKANSLHKCKHSSIEAYKRLYEYVKKTKKHTYTYVYIHI